MVALTGLAVVAQVAGVTVSRVVQGGVVLRAFVDEVVQPAVLIHIDHGKYGGEVAFGAGNRARVVGLVAAAGLNVHTDVTAIAGHRAIGRGVVFGFGVVKLVADAVLYIRDHGGNHTGWLRRRMPATTCLSSSSHQGGESETSGFRAI